MTNRRSFLKKVTFGSAPFILPSHIWAAKGDASPNNRINIAIIGPGKMGRGHANFLVRNPRVQLTGFAEIARFAGLYQTPSNIGQRCDCLGQKLAYHKVTVNGRASHAPHSQARGQAFPFKDKVSKGFVMFCNV